MNWMRLAAIAAALLGLGGGAFAALDGPMSGSSDMEPSCRSAMWSMVPSCGAFAGSVYQCRKSPSWSSCLVAPLGTGGDCFTKTKQAARSCFGGHKDAKANEKSGAPKPAPSHAPANAGKTGSAKSGKTAPKR